MWPWHGPTISEASRARSSPRISRPSVKWCCSGCGGWACNACRSSPPSWASSWSIGISTSSTGKCCEPGCRMALELKSAQFRREREGVWRELEALVERAERSGVESLDGGSLTRLPTLYRATLSSLSGARAISLDRNLLDYLEALSARAYLSVYGVRERPGPLLAAFCAWRLPAAVRAAWRQIALVAAGMLGSAPAAWPLTMAGAASYASVLFSGQHGGPRRPGTPRR